MNDIDELFTALGRSKFRSRFRLTGKEAEYLRDKGLDTILQHARDFVSNGWPTPIPLMTAGKRRCGTTRSLSLSTQPGPAAGAVWPNGTTSQKAGRSHKSR